MPNITLSDLKSRAGRILYRELPEEYRYRDPRPKADEMADLESYLQGAGHLLDLIRGTTEQLYADSFAEEVDMGAAGRLGIQPWLVPYLAELVGADLLAPDPDNRMEELNNSVTWYKSKGTLRTVDDVSDVVAGAETVAREGWRLVLTTPRMTLPPFSRPLLAQEQDPSTGRLRPSRDLLNGALGYLGCPDFHRVNRAVQDLDGSNPIQALSFPQRDAEGHVTAAKTLYWSPLNPGGVPAFPGHFDDTSPRCPDLRDDPLGAMPGPQPRRSVIHIRPPDGFFAEGLRRVVLDDPSSLDLAGRKTLSPLEILKAVDPPSDAERIPNRLVVELTADLTIPPQSETHMVGLLFVGTGRLRVAKGARLSMRNCAAPEVVIAPADDLNDDAAFLMTEGILGALTGGDSFAQLEYVTVTGQTDLGRLNASDCILVDVTDNLTCSLPTDDTDIDDEEPVGPVSCIRYSRVAFSGHDDAVERLAKCFLTRGATNTGDAPRFVERWVKNGSDAPSLRAPGYGVPGYGVLDTTTPISITQGAEDNGEMGAGHGHFHAASLHALRKKLRTFLPLGQELSLIYDAHLALIPPTPPQS